MANSGGTTDTSWMGLCESLANEYGATLTQTCDGIFDDYPDSEDRNVLKAAFLDHFVDSFTKSFWRLNVPNLPPRNDVSPRTKQGAISAVRGSKRDTLKKFICSKKSDSKTVKEGMVSIMSLEYESGAHKWEKCRVQLFAVPNAQHVLELYCPPRVKRPRYTLMCNSIMKCRRTTAMEFPDKDSTFAILSDDTDDIVIDCKNAATCLEWLTAIKQAVHCDKGDKPLSLDDMSDDDDLGLTSSDVIDSRHFSLLNNETSAEVSTTGTGTSQDMVFPFTEASTLLWYSQYQGNGDIRIFPWYHGRISRCQAASLVLAGGSHGSFLLRCSETNEPEFVLSFSFHGKAKHIRFSVNRIDGVCLLQHLRFPSPIDMLENFRTNPIPMETNGLGNVSLIRYIKSRNSVLNVSLADGPVHIKLAQDNPYLLS